MAVAGHQAEVSLVEPEQLGRYADAIVRGCLGVGTGDTLLVTATPAGRELAVALTTSGYRAGAVLVDVSYSDPRARAARLRTARTEDLGPMPPWERRRFRQMTEPETASVTILPESEPDVFDAIPSERVAADFSARARRLADVRRAFRRGRRRWTGVAWPTEPWARQVFPELDPPEAMRRLARDLLWFCRLGPDDPPGWEGWTRHTTRMAERARSLTELGLSRLELRDFGTKLDFTLAGGTRWLGGRRENAFGKLVSPNFPTEESFTSPDAGATEGMFRCSRPLFFRGRTIEGIAGEFRSGRLVRLEAAHDGDRDFLAAALDADRGARRLGEVALVDRTSRIGQANRIYVNTLLDENAAAHIAFGSGFDQSRLNGPGAGGTRGVNRSSLHLDVMIGTDELAATGVTPSGSRVPLIRDGAWQI